MDRSGAGARHKNGIRCLMENEDVWDAFDVGWPLQSGKVYGSMVDRGKRRLREANVRCFPEAVPEPHN